NAEDLPKEQARTEILSDTRAYPFTINASFRGGCLFRYRPDRKETVEDYFASGDIVNMTASNGIRLWISNGNAVKLQVVANSKTYDLAVPRAGEVIAQDIKWIKDTDGRYKIVVVDID
ncbi:MAG: helix-turn-helix domain-containing protein, partial [Treponema sp.]|nr:helix-turn-helix domain-containing protein [Treponema sp.]